jgi:hypothetical protein
MAEPWADGTDESAATALDVARLAAEHRRLILSFGVAYLSYVVARVSVLFVTVTVVALVALAIYGYRTAMALGMKMPLVWGAVMCIPLVQIVSLFVLSSRSTRVCREHGVEVGFLGPKLPAVVD